VAVALGSFGLIHAGTIRFLRQACAAADRLFVAVLPEAAAAEGLMRPQERLRVLKALEEVAGADFLPLDPAALDQWKQAAPEAPWFRCAAENDVAPETLARLAETGLNVRSLEDTGECTTAALLERMGRGKEH
jgi:cytidyltransferase-like protein